MTSSKLWTSPVSAAKKEVALAVARKITAAISSCVVADSNCFLAMNSFRGFDPLPLAVLYSVNDRLFPNCGFQHMSHRLLEAAINQGMIRGRIALFGGLSQLGVSADYLSRTFHYEQLLAWTDHRIVALSKGMAESTARAVLTDGLKFSDYDLVSGLSGAVRYMLLRRAHLLREDIEYVLRELSSPIDREGVFALSVKSENIEGYLAGRVDRSERLINCGFAHGVPGTLAVLSLAWKHGFASRSVRAAVQKLTDYLLEAAIEDEHGMGWPDAHTYPTTAPTKVTMDAWCYGSAGIARAIWLSSLASNKKSDADVAVSALHSAITRELSTRRLKGPWLCHGLAGLLLILIRFYNECPDSMIADGIDQILDRLLEHYDETNLLGFADRDDSGNRSNDLSFLNGSCGIALVLYSVASDLEPRWDSLLAVS